MSLDAALKRPHCWRARFKEIKPQVWPRWLTSCSCSAAAVLKPLFLCLVLLGLSVEPHLGLIFHSDLLFHGFPYRCLTQGPSILPSGKEAEGGPEEERDFPGVPVDFLLQASSLAFSGTPNSLLFFLFFNKINLLNCLYSYFAEDRHLEASDSNQDSCISTPPFWASMPFSVL